VGCYGGRGAEESMARLSKKARRNISLCGSENWTLTVSQRRKIEEAEMKFLRPLAGHTVNDYKKKYSIRRELQTECILNKIDE
jgi:hypothetical protein